MSDTFCFLHHTLPVPTISNTDRIVKATQHLVRTIDGHQDAPPDELRAIQQLRDLLTGAAQQPSTTDSNRDIETDITNPAKPIAEPAPIPQPIHTSPDPIHTAPAARPHANLPNVVPFDDNKYEPPADPAPRYNLRSRNHIVMSAIALVGEANARGMLVNVVIDQETGDSMEYRHLIKHPKYKEVWTKSYASELGRLTNGIRDIPGTNTMTYIKKSDIPKDRLKTLHTARSRS